MAYKYKKLFEPYKIGNVTIRNRFSMTPMLLSSCFDTNGAFTEEGIHYYEERAQGGFGLIFTGALIADMEVDPYSHHSGYSNPLYSPVNFIRTGKELTDRCHKYDSKIFAEITLGMGRNAPGNKTPSPVELFGDPNTSSEEISVEEIQKKVQAVVEAAAVVKAAGFDGVDVHGFHWGYLLDEFASSLVNKRTDQYGGSLENRIRICKEVIDGIKETCGDDFPVTIRVNMDSYIKGLNNGALIGEETAGRTVEENVQICKMLESYGYDCILIDAGIYESFYYACPPMYIEKGFTLDLAKEVKNELTVPLIVTGSRIDEPDYLLEAVQDDTADAVGLARASLADPFLPKKYEAGKIEDVRPCIGCNTCFQTITEGGNLHCAVNPTVTREELVRLRPTINPKKVVIIGGGIAGMEAAQVLKLQGHDVTIYEKSDKLGGNLNAAGAHDFKHDVGRLNVWYQKQMKDLDIPIKLNTELSTQDIIGKNPDVAILATGSVPVSIEFEGSDSPKVISSLDAIYDEKQIGDKVVIVGGGQIGCEIGLDLAEKGKDVSIVEILDDILTSSAPLPFINRMALVKLLEKEEVNILTSAHFDSVDETGANVSLTKENKEVHLDADTVIIAVGMKAKPSFASELFGTGIEVYEVGDGLEVGDVHTTIHSAFEIARRI